MKLWEGRFTQPSAKSADEFNQSLGFDYKLYWHDILASIAHVKMLGETQIIPKENADKISDALVNILADIEKGSLALEGAEDIHTFVEQELTKRIGAVGKNAAHRAFAQRPGGDRPAPVRKGQHRQRVREPAQRSSTPFWRSRATTCSSSCPAIPICAGRSPFPWRSTSTRTAKCSCATSSALPTAINART